jgi:hypothetical protein
VWPWMKKQLFMELKRENECIGCIHQQAVAGENPEAACKEVEMYSTGVPGGGGR